MDHELNVMILSNVVVITEHLAKHGQVLDDVDWDAPLPHGEFNPPELLNVSHSIGVVCGIAAGLDRTPRELLWSLGIDTEITPTPTAIDVTPAPKALHGRRRKRSHAVTVKAKAVKP